MKGTMFVTGVVSVGILFLASGANAAGIKEGEWSMTTVIHIPGSEAQMAEAQEAMANMSDEEKAMMERMMGGMKMGAAGGGGMQVTTTQCITNDNPVPEASENEECQTTHTMKGNTVNFEAVCENSRATGKITYKGNTMKGTIQSIQDNGEKVNVDITGEYVGPCGSDAAAAAQNLTERELALRERELAIKEKELEVQEAANGKKTKGKPTLQDVDNAVNTTNNVKNTVSGLRSLLGN